MHLVSKPVTATDFDPTQSFYSDVTSTSRFMNDNAKSIHQYHHGLSNCGGQGAYDKLSQKSLLDLSIKTG